MVLGAAAIGPACRPTCSACATARSRFARHYTASNDCTPRALDAADRAVHPPDGLHDHGRQHPRPRLSRPGGRCCANTATTPAGTASGTSPTTTTAGRPRRGERALERYGFAGGTYPSPDGAPGQGWRVDPHIAGQFARLVRARGRRRAVVHDGLVRQPARHRVVVPAGATASPAEAHGARSVVHQLPPNFETPELLIERRKPRLQRSLQETAAASFGPVPFTGPEAAPRWLGLPRPLRQAPARGRRAHRPCAATPWTAVRRSRPTR